MNSGRLRLLLAATMVLGLVACSPGDELAEQIAESQEGVGDVEIDTDTGEVSVETEDGSFTIGGGEIPADWPVDVPSGGAVVASGEDDTGGGTLSMEFQGADYDDIVSFYDNWVEESGMELIQRVEVSDPAGHAWTVQDGEKIYTISTNDVEDFVALLIVIVSG
jgi:hypothetical protein